MSSMKISADVSAMLAIFSMRKHRTDPASFMRDTKEMELPGDECRNEGKLCRNSEALNVCFCYSTNAFQVVTLILTRIRQWCLCRFHFGRSRVKPMLTFLDAASNHARGERRTVLQYGVEWQFPTAGPDLALCCAPPCKVAVSIQPLVSSAPAPEGQHQTQRASRRCRLDTTTSQKTNPPATFALHRHPQRLYTPDRALLLACATPAAPFWCLLFFRLHFWHCFGAVLRGYSSTECIVYLISRGC